VIEKLENNEHILLMYLADELPAGDRADVERMLAADASLRRGWQELQALHATVGHGLGRLDEISPMPVNADFALRQVGRAMRQKMAQPAIASAAAASGRAPRSWWWLYPTVTAASIAIIAMVWLNRQQSPTSMPAAYPPLLPSDSPEPLADSQNANESDDELLIDSFTPSAGSEQKDVRAADEDSKQRVATGDVVPQDEISRYLLSATASEQ
jgi:anti-sigma factor RsiW